MTQECTCKKGTSNSCCQRSRRPPSTQSHTPPQVSGAAVSSASAKGVLSLAARGLGLGVQGLGLGVDDGSFGVPARVVSVPAASSMSALDFMQHAQKMWALPEEMNLAPLEKVSC